MATLLPLRREHARWLREYSFGHSIGGVAFEFEAEAGEVAHMELAAFVGRQFVVGLAVNSGIP